MRKSYNQGVKLSSSQTETKNFLFYGYALLPEGINSLLVPTYYTWAYVKSS